MSYCTKNDVNSLFGDISDDVSDDMFNTAIENASAWIDSNLKKNYVPIPEVTVEETQTVNESEELDEAIESEETSVTESTTEQHSHIQYNLINVPSGLKAASIYYAASDILLSLYHGDELPVQYDVWFNKAQQLLDDYIQAYLHEDASSEDLVAHQMVKHSKCLTYNQKRNRRRFY